MLRVLSCAASICIVVVSLAWSGESKSPTKTDKLKTDNKWHSMFDGKTLKGWQVIAGKENKEADYENHGPVAVKDGCMLIGKGRPITGIRWKDQLPKSNYEMAFQARRVEGYDFFCGLTFPVGDGALTLILGGWGGWVVGLSNIDGERAVDNETSNSVEFKNGRWYDVRIQVIDTHVNVWVDKQQIVEFERANQKLEVDWAMEPCLPCGIATYDTTGAIRQLRFRTLPKK